MSGKNIVIIGGGMAGLTTAAYLVKEGYSVRIFEQHYLPGGYVSSFARGGFTFPAGPTSFGSNGIIFPILNELGLDKHIKFVEAHHQISWGANDISLQNPTQTMNDLKASFPNERNALRRYFRWVDIGSRAFRDSLKSGLMFGRDVLKNILKLGFKHPLFTWAFWVASKHTNRSLHDYYFNDKTLRQLLNQLGYPVMSGKNELGMWSSYFFDTWVPVGGMQVLPNIFEQFILENGGELTYGKSVKKIIIKNEQACGVELQNGELIYADYVVSAADFNKTCLQMIGRSHLSKEIINKIENAQPSESVFAVFLGIFGSSEISASLKRFKQSHVNFTCKDGKYIQLVLLSKDDPTTAPEGKHALFIASLSPYGEWVSVKNNQQLYKTKKEEYTEEIISRAEEFIPGLRAHISVLEAATPLTYERYTGNWCASTSGWNWDPKVAPHFEFSKELPIKNFYPVGHYVHNPGGVPTAMITAWYTAQTIIKQRENLSD